jgi:uncharacterized protein (TIGR02466 family)
MLYNLFPLTVYKVKAGLEPKTRKAFAGLIESQNKMTSDPNRRSTESWTGGMHGILSLHMQKQFDPLFRLFPQHIGAYMAKLGFDLSQLDVFVTRSWGTFGRSNETISPHVHTSSALSVAYYVSLPEGSASISFEADAHQNEPIRGLFREGRHRGLIDPNNPLSATAVSMEVEEDDIVIFPSLTLHGVMPGKQKEPRISIAADTLLMTKQITNSEKLLPPMSNWRQVSPAPAQKEAKQARGAD